MNYRPNYGNSYMDAGNRLGYSSVSKNYGLSNRSIFFVYLKITPMMTKTTEKLSLCLKTKERNLNKQNRSMNMI